MDTMARAIGGDVEIWGRNAVVGTALEELYAYDQPLSWPAILPSAALLDVSSASANDKGTPTVGTGAQKLLIFGLDGDFKPVFEEVILNGQTVVTTTKAFLRVFGAEVTVAGSGLTNAGDLHIVKTGTGGTYTAGVPGTITSGICKVMAGYGSSQNGIFTVPAGKTATLKGLMLTARAQACTFQLVTQNLADAADNAMHVDFPVEVAVNSTAFLSADQLRMKHSWKEKTDIRLRVLAASASGIATGMMLLEVQ